LVFYQTIGVQQKFNTDYIQLLRLNFIHFILMHSQTSNSNFMPNLTHKNTQILFLATLSL